MLSLNKYKLAYRLLIGYIYVMLFAGVVFKYIGISNELGFILLTTFDVLPLIMWFLSNPSLGLIRKRCLWIHCNFGFCVYVYLRYCC